MNILLQLENEEDINYLQAFSEEKKDLIAKTALSIGLKSIQMSEVNMDCHSYIDPIREIVSQIQIKFKKLMINWMRCFTSAQILQGREDWRRTCVFGD